MLSNEKSFINCMKLIMNDKTQLKIVKLAGYFCLKQSRRLFFYDGKNISRSVNFINADIKYQG